MAKKKTKKKEKKLKKVSGNVGGKLTFTYLKKEKEIKVY